MIIRDSVIQNCTLNNVVFFKTKCINVTKHNLNYKTLTIIKSQI